MAEKKRDTRAAFRELILDSGIATALFIGKWNDLSGSGTILNAAHAATELCCLPFSKYPLFLFWSNKARICRALMRPVNNGLVTNRQAFLKSL